jgi:hypothetical protein
MTPGRNPVALELSRACRNLCIQSADAATSNGAIIENAVRGEVRMCEIVTLQLLERFHSREIGPDADKPNAGPNPGL